ncbi:S-adenosyl-L-methionine-dependent methyltransferase [Crucibulum laeve]|uniref:S-adenosyl-L-methionine-dependent methyltransferase n=1 Tax=Crucibulum laeve TaxID=68775 RepID=A0A5C3M2I7_9AGAR|nr:S-adenosyl-L-methionine-dependent methyltransferase [Crucibulum laeve]
MGRNNKRRDGRSGDTGNRKSKRAEDERTDLIEKIDMNNEKLFAYYKAQKVVPEEEWDEFVEALRQHLPTTFRVAGSRQTANNLNETIKSVHVPSLSNVIFEDQPIPPPVQLSWYPDGLAWQFNVPKKVLRKSPEFKKFHSFLVFETEVGNVSRQEAVSMLPPLFLDFEPHHKVMDMCAAPGSKTAQILEALHAQDTITSTSIPSGLLLANDSDNKRTHLLIHQSARLPSPALMVTNLDASNYPSIKIPTQTKGPKRLEQLLFDRILCDVPCSGDGTIRKNMGIWKSWQPGDGNGLHSLQVRILQRAMKLLKEDGRIVYSTCSLNPVENEAVIAEALKVNPDFELVDVSSKLPELKHRPGLTTWRATADRTISATYESYEEFMASSLDENLKAKMTEGHWPPLDVEKLNLPRCLRIYPHLQDSGGFFVAVLEKRRKSAPSKELKREASEPADIPKTKKPRLEDTIDVSEDPNVAEEAAGIATPVDDVEMPTESSTPALETESSPKSADGGGGSFKENPYTFLPPDDPILQVCIKRLHMTSSFPSSNVLVRNPAGDAVRSLYLANDVVKSVIENNDYSRIRLTAAGTKVFSKQEGGQGADAQFRVLGEGLPVILPYVDPSTVITADLPTLKTLIESYYPLCSTFDQPFRETVEARPTGSHIVRFLPGEMAGVILTHELVLPIWKSNVSLTLMIDKKAKSALSLRLFGADITTAGKAAAAVQKPSAQPTPDAIVEDVTLANEEDIADETPV